MFRINYFENLINYYTLIHYSIFTEILILILHYMFPIYIMGIIQVTYSIQCYMTNKHFHEIPVSNLLKNQIILHNNLYAAVFQFQNTPITRNTELTEKTSASRIT